MKRFDVDALVGLLRDDAVLSMPLHAFVDPRLFPLFELSERLSLGR